MKMLIFDLITVSILLCHVPEPVVGQNGQANGIEQERNRIERHSQLPVGKHSPLYIMSNIDKASEFRRTRLANLGTAGTISADPKHAIHLTGLDPHAYYRRSNGSVSTSRYDLQFDLDPQSTANKLELVRKLDPQLYQLNSKSFIPSPYTRKNDFKIAEQLLLILLQENLKKPHQ